jgi:D-alanyl-D-alanine dipeptidase
MVDEASRAMPDGFTLCVRSGLRTIEMQRETRERITAGVVEKHPEWSKATLNRMLNRVIAPIDLIAPPPHTTGGAVDVGVTGPDGKDLDFSTPLEGWNAAPTYTPGLSPIARVNRLLVVHAMEGAGLTNYAGEWWHWSYGDQGWALRVGSPTCLYGVAFLEDAENKRVPEPPKEEEPEAAKA